MENARPHEPNVDPDLKRPDEAIKDLEPDEHEGESVKGGVALDFTKIEVTYKTQN